MQPDIDDLDNRICVMPAEITKPYNSFANAAFIVRACNSHDKMVAALKRSRRFIEAAYGNDKFLEELDGAIAAACE